MQLIDYKQFDVIKELSSPSKEIFLSASSNGQIPMLIRGVMTKWRSFQYWDAEFFKQNYGTLSVVTSRSNSESEYRDFSVSEYMDYLYNCEDENPYYLRDWQFHLHDKQLRSGYEVPKYFECWSSELPPDENPNFSWFYIGPCGSFSPLHIDVLNTAAWNAVMRGKKLWMFFSPEQDGFLYNGKVNPFYPDYSKFPLFFNAKPLVCIQKEGDIVFTPSGWWHAVMNLEPCISLTENFINDMNYKEILSYLERNKMSQELEMLNEFIKERSH